MTNPAAVERPRSGEAARPAAIRIAGGVSSTAMVVSGAKKPHWIDFNAGTLLDGVKTMAPLEDDLFATVLAIASGTQLANNEKNGYREIAIWKEGVTL